MQLKEGSIEIPTEEELLDNKVNRKIIDDYEIRILQIKKVPTGLNFDEALKDKKLSVQAFVNDACGLSRGERVLKDEVMAMVDYAEITGSDVSLQKEKPTPTRVSLTLQDSDIARWALEFVEQTGPHIGDISRKSVEKLIKSIFAIGIRVDTAYAIDRKKALRALKKKIIEFYGQKSSELMFESKFTFRKENVKNIFKDSKVFI